MIMQACKSNCNAVELMISEHILFCKLAKSCCHELNSTNHAKDHDELCDMKDATAMNVVTSQKTIAMILANQRQSPCLARILTVTVMLHLFMKSNCSRLHKSNSNRYRLITITWTTTKQKSTAMMLANDW